MSANNNNTAAPASAPAAADQSTSSRVNSVDVGEAAGWQTLDLNSIYAWMSRVQAKSREPAMIELLKRSEAQYMSQMMELFPQEEDNFPTLFKYAAVRLNPHAKSINDDKRCNSAEEIMKTKEEIATMLSTLQLMKSSKNPRAVEMAYSADFNRRNNSALMNKISPEQLQTMQKQYINKNGEFAPGAGGAPRGGNGGGSSRA
jgi:hypothetical protein